MDPHRQVDCCKCELLIFSSVSHVIFCLLLRDGVQKFSETQAEGLPMLRTQQDRTAWQSQHYSRGYPEVDSTYAGYREKGARYPNGMSSTVSVYITDGSATGVPQSGQRKNVKLEYSNFLKLNTNT